LPEPEPVFRSDEEFKSAKASLDVKGISDVQVLGDVPKSYWKKQPEVKEAPKPEGLQVLGKVPESYWASLRAEADRVVPEMKDFDFKTSGAKIRSGVDVGSLRDDVYPGVEKVINAYKAIGVTPEITSGFRTPETLKRKTDGKVKRSFHLLGRGVDFGWATLNAEQREALKRQFDSLATRGKTRNGNDIWSFDGFELIIHDEGFGEHVHLEHDTDETQVELDKKMAELNKDM
jgi:hypothetical protein